MTVGFVYVIFNVIDYVILVFYNALLQYLINELEIEKRTLSIILLCPARATVIH